ncbi:MAG: carboxypeptidase regulatory-like domain-containing protein [Bacteroidota bacterium]|nr:carboxypeptidase regulatory-like domain-containing protein [Bacteroidota bacterium]
MKKLILLLIIIIIKAHYIYAQTGAIFGQVMETGTTKMPVAAVQINVKGTAKTTKTDSLGMYEIGNLKAGEYTLEFVLSGYEKIIYNDLKVTANERLKQDVEMAPIVVTMDQEVKVIGKRKLIDIEKPQSGGYVSQEQLELSPVRSVEKIINTQAGVMNSPAGINIRGGRSYETGFLVDGVSATDPLSGTGFGLDLGSNSVQDIEVTTGGIGADVGDATAGVVSTKLKSGGDKTEIFAQYKRDNFGNYKTWNSVFNQQSLEMNYGGSIKIKKAMNGSKAKKLRFYTAGKIAFTDEYTRNPANQVISSLYPNTKWTPYQDNRWSGMVKLNYDFNPKLKLSFSYVRSLTVNQDINMLRVTGNDVGFNPGYQYIFSKQMDNANTFTHDSYLAIVTLQHTPTRKFTHKTTFSRLFVKLRADANGREWRPDVVNTQMDPDNIVTFPVTYFSKNDSLNFVNPTSGLYNNNGIATLWHSHYVEEYVFRWNGTYYSNKFNRVNFGTEMKFQELQWIDVNRPWVGAPIQLANGQYTQSFRLGDNSDIWKVNVQRGGFFVTDKIKYKGLIADLGLRFEYWAPGKYVDAAIANPNAPILEQVRQDYIKSTVKLFDRRYKFRMLPRIAASFPIRDKQMLYFNYGHTTILPHPSYIYAGLNPLYTDRSTIARLGNPNLNPEVDISYEIGLRSEITSNDALNVSAYMKDKYDFVTSASVLIPDATGRMVSRTLRINSDYARMRGIEVTYIKRIKNRLVGQASISYMIATGQSSSANEALKELLATGAREDTKEFYLAWDRPIDAKMNLTYKVADKKGLWNNRFNRFALYAEMNYRSGRRYTPYISQGNEPITNRPIFVQDPNPDAKFSKLGTSWFWIDMNFRKWWTVKKTQIAFTFEITNILNNRNATIINPVTGTAYKSGQNVPTEWQDPRYIDPRDPRSSGLPPLDPSRYSEQRHYMVGVLVKF